VLGAGGEGRCAIADGRFEISKSRIQKAGTRNQKEEGRSKKQEARSKKGEDRRQYALERRQGWRVGVNGELKHRAIGSLGDRAIEKHESDFMAQDERASEAKVPGAQTGTGWLRRVA
jgi:hypothetical protein